MKSAMREISTGAGEIFPGRNLPAGSGKRQSAVDMLATEKPTLAMTISSGGLMEESCMGIVRSALNF